MHNFFKYIISSIILIYLSGCVSTAPVSTERYVWPPAPDTPRIQWLGTYHSHLDLKQTFSRSLKEALMGEDTPIAFKKPVEVRSDSARNKFYVCDLEMKSVLVFDLEENEVRSLSFNDSGVNEFSFPISMAIDRSGNLYVLDKKLKRIFLFDSSEKFIRSIQLDKLSPLPIAIALDPSGERLYLADAQLGKVFALDRNGTRLFTINGSEGSANEPFNRPVGLAVIANGDIIIAESFNVRIQIFDKNGTYIRSFGRRGTADGDFQLLKSLAADSHGNIYVIDGRSNNIKIFSQTGDFLMALGSYYAVSLSGKIAPGGFALPTGIDIDLLDNIFVTDTANRRIQIFKYLSGNK